MISISKFCIGYLEHYTLLLHDLLPCYNVKNNELLTNQPIKYYLFCFAESFSVDRHRKFEQCSVCMLLKRSHSLRHHLWIKFCSSIYWKYSANQNKSTFTNKNRKKYHFIILTIEKFMKGWSRRLRRETWKLTIKSKREAKLRAHTYS